MRMRVLGWLAGGLGSAVLAAGAALPGEVTVLVPTRLELIANGKSGGSIGLRAGEKLTVVDATDAYVVVRYRNLSGRVVASHTDLPPAVAAVTPVATPSAVASPLAPRAAPAPTPVPAAPIAPAPVSTPREARPPATAIERSLAGKLVALENGGLRPRDPSRLAGVKFFGIYFSASWCGPCRAYTPDLIDAYGKIRALYPEFEVVHVNRDKSPADMAAYMRDDRMPWPALEWSAIRGTREITRYAGSGIPCLVLIDADGKVLSDSYRWGRYVGPDAVLEDTWRILRDYRRTHPRPKT